MRRDRAARRQLDRRGRARSRARRRPDRGVRQGALDAAAARGVAVGRGRRLSRSNWSTARTACRPARPACSTTAPRARRACSAAASSAPRRRPRGAEACRRTPDRGSSRGNRGAMAARSTATRSRRPMRAGRRSTTSCSARCSSAAAGLDRGGRGACRAWRRAHSRGRRRHRHFAADYRAQQPHRRHRHLGADAAHARRSASPSTGSTNVEALAVMDAKHLALPDASFDVVVAQYVITAVPDPEATLDEFVARAQARRRDHPGQSPRRRERAFAAPSSRASAPIARRLGWSPEFPWARLTRLGRARRRAADRAPADAAARAFLADPVCADGGATAPRRSITLDRDPVCMTA